jgi:predicted O-methyltransferase YrrM
MSPPEIMTHPICGKAFRLLTCSEPVIDEMYRSRAIECSDGSKRPMNVYIPREEGDYLYSLIRYLLPQCTIEIGMANGLSTLFMAAALRDNGVGRHIAIDPFQSSDWAGAGVTALRCAGLNEFVQLVEKPSHQALPELEQSGFLAQFVFIDGNHLFDYILSDFLCCDRILEVGGLVAFDDSDWPASTQVIRYVLANRNYEIAFPEVVIEPPRISPSLPSRLLRAVAGKMPTLAMKLRPDFMVPTHMLGVRGRCVVLRKVGPDDRDGQSRFHNPF